MDKPSNSPQQDKKGNYMQAARKLPAQNQVIVFPKVKLLSSEQWLVGSHIITSLIALSVNIFLRPFQLVRQAPMLKMQIPVFSYDLPSIAMRSGALWWQSRRG